MDAPPIASVEADDDGLFHSLPFGWRGDVRAAHGSGFRRSAKERNVAQLEPLADTADFGGPLADIEEYAQSMLPDHTMGDLVFDGDEGYVADDDGEYIADADGNLYALGADDAAAPGGVGAMLAAMPTWAWVLGAGVVAWWLLSDE